MTSLGALIALTGTSAAGANAAGDSLVEGERWEIDRAYGAEGVGRVGDVYNETLVIDPSGRAYTLAERIGEPDVTYLVRFAETGQLDPAFGEGGFVETRLGGPEQLTMVLQTSGAGPRLVVSQWSGQGERLPIYRFRMNGALDRSFGDRGVAKISTSPMWMDVRDLAIGADDAIFAAGNCTKTDIHYQPCVVSVTADGEPNRAFDDDGYKLWTGVGTKDAFILSVTATVERPRIYIGGYSDEPGAQFLLGAFKANGGSLKRFGGDGSVLLRHDCGSERASMGELHAEPAGAVIVSGVWCDHTAFARLRADGALDRTFGGDGWTDLGDGDGGVSSSYDPGSGSVYWVHGGQDGLHVGAVRADGTLDPGFGPPGELVLDVEPGDDMEFGSLGVGLDGSGRLYATGWYPRDFLGMVVGRAVRSDALDPDPLPRETSQQQSRAGAPTRH